MDSTLFSQILFVRCLRGLNAISIWAEKTKQVLPRESVVDVMSFLSNRFSDGMLKPERLSYEGVGTILPTASGEWIRKQPATFFPLLDKVSAIGEVSPFLSKQWLQAKDRVQKYSILGNLP